MEVNQRFSGKKMEKRQQGVNEPPFLMACQRIDARGPDNC